MFRLSINHISFILLKIKHVFFWIPHVDKRLWSEIKRTSSCAVLTVATAKSDITQIYSFANHFCWWLSTELHVFHIKGNVSSDIESALTKCSNFPVSIRLNIGKCGTFESNTKLCVENIYFYTVVLFQYQWNISGLFQEYILPKWAVHLRNGWMILLL